MKFSDKGIPILTLEDKLRALNSCIKAENYEDVVGHLCDLLAYFGKKIEPSVGPKMETLQELVAYYGEDVAPIEEE